MQSLAVKKVATKLYAGTYSSPARILRIDHTTMTLEDRLILASGDDRVYYNSIAVKDYFLYAALNAITGGGRVAKVNLYTFAHIGTLVFPADYRYAQGMQIVGTKAYCGGVYQGGVRPRVSKVNLPSFTHEAIMQPYADLGRETISLEEKDNFLYVGLSTPRLCKVNLATFLTVGNISGINYPRDLEIVGDYLYIAGTTLAKVEKIDLTTFTKVGELPITGGSSALAAKEPYLYVGTWQTPARIVKIDLTTWTQVDALTLPTGYNNILTMAIEGNYLFASTYPETPSKVVKIDLTTFTKTTEELTLDVADVWAYAFLAFGIP